MNRAGVGVAFRSVSTTYSPRCPAAAALAGPEPLGPSVVCRVLARDRNLDPNSQQEDTTHVVFTSRQDPSVYFGACCSRYERCSIWEAEKKRIAAQREGLSAEAPDAHSAGIEQYLGR